MSNQPYTIHVPQAVLDDLQSRLSATRWTNDLPGSGWGYGTDENYLKGLLAYWQNGFDWRAQEAKLNHFSHYRAVIEEATGSVGIHYIYERGKGKNPMPLILTHGWPDSFYRMVKLIPLLTNPAAFGG